MPVSFHIYAVCSYVIWRFIWASMLNSSNAFDSVEGAAMHTSYSELSQSTIPSCRFSPLARGEFQFFPVRNAQPLAGLDIQLH